MKISLVIIGTLTLASLNSLSTSAHATDYYFDPVAGDDGNEGTSAVTAWKSLAKINSMDLEPGDTLNLRAGRVFKVDHPHTVLFFQKGMVNGKLIDDSGTPDNPIIVRPYGQGEKPRIEQTFNSKYNSAVLGFSGPVGNIVIDGLHLVGLKGPYDTATGKDGLDVFSTALLSYEGEGYSKNVTIKNCEIEGGCRGLLLYRCANYIIENNYIHDVDGANTNTRDWAPLWPDNHLKKGQPGFPMDKNASPNGMDNDSGAEAIDLSSTCHDIRIASNRIDDVHYNSFDYGLDGTFIEVYGSDIRNIEVCYNTINNATGGTVEMGHWGGGTVDGFNFHHNLIANGTTFYSIHAEGQFGLSKIVNLQFNNNTFLQRSIEDDTQRPWAIFDVTGKVAHPEDLKVQNNIFYLGTGTKVSWNGGPAPEISAIMGNDDVFTHKNNIFRRAPGALGTYRFNLPLDPSEIADRDPGFVDLAKDNFTLTATSPAKGTGLDLGYTRDLAGNKISAGRAPNIGAFEGPAPAIALRPAAVEVPISLPAPAQAAPKPVAALLTATPANPPGMITITGATAGAEQADNVKEQAFDGDNSTRWCNDGDVANAWIQLDLGASHDVNKLRLMLENGHIVTYPIKIEVGDGANFTTVFEGPTALIGWKAFQDFTFAPAKGRFVRLSMTGKNSFGTNWFSAWEIQAYGAH